MIQGIINVLKPPGMTSADVVYWLRRRLQTKKIGHTGTLDPGVTGVLPVCVGQATRLAEYLTEQGKEYRAEITLGVATTTQDGFGEITEEKNASGICPEDLLNVLPAFCGPILQVPPVYSAVRKEGKRLYEYARAGLEIEVEPRMVTIYSIKMSRFIRGEKPRAMLDISCSKGTYIRTLCHDIGRTLGCGAYMSDLLRVRSGPYVIKNSFTLEEIQAQIEQGTMDFLLPLHTGLDLPVINLPSARIKAFQNGLSTYLSQPDSDLKEGDHVQVWGDEVLLGIGIWQKGEICPHKVL